MINKKYWISVGVLILCIILFFAYKVYSDFSDNSEIPSPIEYSKTLNFEKNDNEIFIKTRMWGLLGNHSCIYISNKDSELPDKETDIILDVSGIYYKKQEPDSLLIFMPSMSFSEEEENIFKNIGDIHIRIHRFKASLSSKYIKNYKAMGLSKVSVYDGIGIE